MITTAVKTMHGFIPGNQEQYSQIPMGATVKVEYIQKRKYENHKRFFSFIDTVFDMQEFYDSKEVLRKYLTMKAGYFTTMVTPKGATIFIADSIAFDKMDETKFKDLFSKCIDIFLRELATDCDENQLMQIINFG